MCSKYENEAGEAAVRTILHSDLNNFYASVECVYRPELRKVPLAVCGDPEARHGIVRGIARGFIEIDDSVHAVHRLSVFSRVSDFLTPARSSRLKY